ncbi:porin PorA family protein, partial [Mycobacteroides abscessus]
MNRGVMMRIAACGLLGLGSALIIAALLLSTYTSNRLAKIPLDWDATLVSEGKGRALDPASLSGQKFIADPDRPLALQEQISTVSPADATKVGLQAGITL